jgi:DNA polymerase III epsilon subunit family exonuclease
MIVLDLETTGFNPRKDKIIDIAALRINRGKIVDSFVTLINPKIPIPFKITSLTHISQQDVKDAPTFDKVSSNLLKFMRGHRIIGYNISFDKRFLVKSERRFSCLTYFDYLKFIRGLDYEMDNYKLKTVTNYFGIHKKPTHRALADAETLVELIRILGT